MESGSSVSSSSTAKVYFTVVWPMGMVTVAGGVPSRKSPPPLTRLTSTLMTRGAVSVASAVMVAEKSALSKISLPPSAVMVSRGAGVMPLSDTVTV